MPSHHLRRSGPPEQARTDRSTRPVFVDRSGRRRRLVTVLGAAFGVLLLLGLIGLGASLMGGDPAQPPGWPGQEGAAELKPSAERTAAPSRTAEPSPSVTTSPSATPKKSATTAPPGQTNTHRPTAKPSNTRKP